MKKYSINLIMDYINGNDINNSIIELLEKDYEFMTEVIEYSNDKNIYNLCDNSLKVNYDFVKFLYNKFQDDKKFINEVIDYCLNNGNLKDIEKDELIVIMYELNQDIIDGRNLFTLKYGILSSTIYNSNISDLNIIQEKFNNQNDFGLGFMIILEKYRTSKIIIDFFAKKLCFNIFSQNHSFEGYLHQKNLNLEKINMQGFNNFIINYLMNYDEYLSGYVSCNINLLDNIKQFIVNLFKKDIWDDYENKLYNMRLSLIKKISEKYSDYIPITSDNLFYYALKEVNINYDNYSDMKFNINILNDKQKALLFRFVSNIKEIFKIYNIDELTKLDIKTLTKVNYIMMYK